MHILVTGGAGYLGSILTQTLIDHGHSVRVYDVLLHDGQSLLSIWGSPLFEFIHADIRDRKALRRALDGVEAVVHLAAIVGDPACARQPAEAKETNLDGSYQLLEECQRQGISRFLFASTCSNYGKMPDPDGLVDETSTLAPVSLYAETKVEFENAILAIDASSLSTTALRFATIYGVSPRMRFDLTVNEFTKDMLTKKSLTVFGEQFWRPYIHVRDAARAIELVLTSPLEKVRSEVFNVGSTEENYRKIDLVHMIEPHVPEANVQYVRKQEDPRDYRVRFDKIRSALEFQTTRTVEDGIAEVACLVRSGAIRCFDNPSFSN
ncbi:MAG: NAD(P)-dependent oxidoreductase [Acidobacteriaceae bacterium]|nr:NAD(P)-dependent oxidoreductase [Acidobacteriaceae bacterium]